MADPRSPFAIIIAANNEEGYIGPCLDALLAQDDAAGAMRVIVAANACTDATCAEAAARSAGFAARGSRLEILEIAEPGKLNALNRAERGLAAEQARAFLDADVLCDPELIGQIRAALAPDRPLYASGTLAVRLARTWVTRRYAGLWARLPFVEGGAVGAGFFAVNGPGRARWGAFPAIISDDTFVRLNFAPSERIEVPARYHWPMVEGFARLTRVRRRQNAGVDELRRLYPGLMDNEGKARLTRARLLWLALSRPVDLAVYLAVHVAVRRKPPATDWSRGR